MTVRRNSAEYSTTVNKRFRSRIVRLAVLFTGAYLILLAGLYGTSTRYAEGEAKKKIQNLLLNQRALHTYVEEVQKPVIYDLKERDRLYSDFFSPAVLSFPFIARNVHRFFNEERRKGGMPELYYRLASINPRNPLNRADGREREILRKVNEEGMREYSEVLGRDGKTYLYYALPIDPSKDLCLRCHGDPSSAPRELVAMYGTDGGFGEDVGTVRAIISIETPMDEELREGRRVFGALAVMSFGVFAGVFGLVAIYSRRLTAREEEVDHRNRELGRLTKALERERAHLANAQRVARLGSFERNLEDGTEYFSEAVRSIFGIKTSKSITKRDEILALVHPDDLATAKKGFEEAVRKCRPYRFQYRARTTDGREIVIREEGDVAPCGETGPRYVLGTIQDITEEQRAAEELLKRQKLESLGVLAGGIAHDYNNLLTAILGNIEMVRDELPAGDRTRRWLAVAQEASEKARDLTRRLLSFSGAGIERRSVAVEQMVRRAARTTLIEPEYQCTFEAPEDLPTVLGDEGQLLHLFYSLFANAKDAMPGGGTIDVGFEKVVPEDDQLFRLAPGEYVRVTISDGGRGIPREDLPKVCDPYYSTKHRGTPKGVGLGLAIAYAVVDNHGGTLEISSRPGAGTEVAVYLPAKEAPERTGPPEGVPPGRRSASRKILVMDDDELVCVSAGSLLEKLGYEPETVADGEAAVEKYKHALETGTPYAVVLLDMVVDGGMGGAEALKAIQAFDPAVRAILATGYTEDRLESSFRDYGFYGFLPKPFGLRELARVLDQVVGGDRENGDAARDL